MNDRVINVTQSSMPSYEEYIEAIKPLWDSKWLTNMGVFHKELESSLKEYLEVEQVSLTVNGHTALELTLQAFGFPEGSEIITTPFTFISTTHAIVRNRLIPVFCDVKESNGLIDEEKIESLITPKTVAILPVHVYGNVCAVNRIQEIADKYGLKVIYDAAHAFGVKYLDKGIGNYGDASVFSFHATKVFNTIEGGAVTFSDRKLYDKLYNLKNFGIRGEELVVEVGANAKMNEFSAIMGICNLRHIDEEITKRKHAYEYYTSKLEKIKSIIYFERTDGCSNNYSYYPILIKENGLRDELYLYLKRNGINTRKYFHPISADMACFKNRYINCKLDVARSISEHVLVLPLYSAITTQEQDKIINCIECFMKDHDIIE